MNTGMSVEARILEGSLWLILAAVFGIAGFFIARRYFKIRSSGCVAEGVIVGQDQRQADFAPCFFPKVEYQTSDNEKVIFTASAGSGKPAPVGRRVKVIYSSSDPDAADIKTTCRIPFMAMVMFLFMIGFFGMALVYYAGLAGPMTIQSQ